jgi:putative ABC transport system ATP-binding protein
VTLVQTHSLRKDFARGGGTVTAVTETDLSIAAGDFISITGRSGSGKTTLLTMLAGVLTPTGGAVLFEGTDIYALPDKKLSALRNREIGFIPQGAGLLKNFTVFDNVRMPQAFAKGNGEPSGRAAFLLEAVGLRDLADAYPHSLSGGEIRRVAIARALFANPRLVVADEPTSDLDPENAQAVMRILKRINGQGTAVILVTHDEKTAADGTRRFVMREGRLEEFPSLPAARRDV